MSCIFPAVLVADSIKPGVLKHVKLVYFCWCASYATFLSSFISGA